MAQAQTILYLYLFEKHNIYWWYKLIKPTDLLTMALWKIDDPASNGGQRHEGPSACMP